jgi:glycosyltransferase involved in cell wall biosynthesis
VRITVITVCYNAERFLEQTIRSVLSQSYPAIEYIIIDGASNDGTLDIIRKYDDSIAKWISEPDQGIADAMNKGLARASGELVLFLHADDYLIDETVLARAAARMTEAYDIYAFNIHFDRSGRVKLRRPRGLDWRVNFKLGMSHQGVLCRRALFERFGDFDTSFRIDMDYEFVLRVYRQGARMKCVDMPLAVMRDTGISSRTDWPGQRERFLEERRVHRMYCTGPLMRGVYELYWLLYLPYRRIKAIAG